MAEDKKDYEKDSQNINQNKELDIENYSYIDEMDFNITDDVDSNFNDDDTKIYVDKNSIPTNLVNDEDNYDVTFKTETSNMDIDEIIRQNKINMEQNDLTSYTDEKTKEDMLKKEQQVIRKQRKHVRKRKKEKAEKNRFMFRLVWLTMVLVVGSVLGTFFVTGLYDFLAIDRSKLEETEVLITIPKNADLEEVTDILSKNKVINEPFFFKTYAQITNSTEGFLPGTYKIETNLDYEALLNQLLYNSGPKDYVSVQFTEGLTVRECAEILEENNVCESKEFLKACNSNVFDEDYEFIKDIGKVKNRIYKLEGYLFPDTYIFYLNEDVENVITKFLDNFNKKVIKNTKKYSGYSEEMSIKEYADLKDIKLDDLINMASLTQAEASDEKDMYNVTSVFYNRLATEANGGVSYYGDYEVNKLQSDATIYYPYSSKKDIPKDIKKTFKSKYNTYNIDGLPPGPICNAGLIAIDAALNPNDTGYYYFCHRSATEKNPAKAYYAYTMVGHQENLVEAGLVD